MVTDEELMTVARDARSQAYAPYSEYRVGAALLANGTIYRGTNIEIRGAAPIHAEMLATFNAVLDGATDFQRIAVSPSGISGEAPCGQCQYILAEFTTDLRIIEDTPNDESFTEYGLKELIGPAYSPQTDHSDSENS